MNAVERIIIEAIEGGVNLVHRLRRNNNHGGLLLGLADHPHHPSRSEKAYLLSRERLKHTYIVGATGCGKTKLIESLIRQDILSGNGFCLIDPHGDLSQNVLKFLGNLITVSNSLDLLEYVGQKLILIEPFNQEMAVGFNPLEAQNGNHYPLILELMSIFKRLWRDTYWGPRMDELLRNTLLTLSVNNLTLLEAKLLLTNESSRQEIIESLNFSEARDYWLYRYNTLSEKMQVTYREPVLNRISILTADPSIRPIIGQAESTFNFREATDESKWVLINLSKGYLKENTYLFGALFIAKLQLAAMSRVDTPENRRRPFYLYVDEFQNFIGEDFKSILSEARKWALGLVIGHQSASQLDSELRAIILGNVATQIFFRLSHHDASYLSGELSQKERAIIERRLIDFKVGEAYLKRKGERPRLMKSVYVPNPKASPEAIELIKQASLSNYARPRDEVEAEIRDRIRGIHLEQEVDQRVVGTRPQFAPGGRFEEGFDGW